MDPQNPLLSIIIPTKNRYSTLVPVLEALTRHIDSDRLEIVVEDNSSIDGRAALDVLLAADRRIVYHHDERPVSIVDNTIRAIDHSSGDFLLFIGDDDFVTPHVVSIVEQLERTGFPCLVFPGAHYWWSSVKFAQETRAFRPRAFWLPKRNKGTTRVLNAPERLQALLRQGGMTYIDLPRFYHGIVRRDALESIRRETGTYLPGSSPDMAFSVALSLVIGDYLFIDYPVTVFGASKGSGGGSTAERRHFGRIEDQAHLPSDILERWDPRVPRIWSEQTIYPQTIYEVMTRFGRTDRIAYEIFYASLLVNESHLFRHVWPYVADYYAKRWPKLPALLGLLLKKAGGRAYRALQARSALFPYELHEFSSVTEAMNFMAQELTPPCLAPATR